MKRILSVLIIVVLVLSGCGAASSGSSSEASESAAASSAAASESAASSEVPSSSSESTAAAPERTQIRLGLLAGPTGVGAAKLLQDSAEGKTASDCQYTLFNSPTEAAPKLIGGELDIAAVPTNLAAVLYHKTGGQVQLAALNTLGVLYLLALPGEEIHSLQDLAGKTVFSSGQAAVPEYVFTYLLEDAGIRDDVNVVYEAEHDAVIAALAAGKAQIAILPEPKVTAALGKIEGLSVALDLTEEWNKVCEKNGSAAVLSMGCLVVRKAFADEHPEALSAFLDEYRASIEYMKDEANRESAAALCERFGIIPKAAVAAKALPGCSLCFIAGQEMKAQIAPFYQILFDYDPASVGGKIPDDGLYYLP